MELSFPLPTTPSGKSYRLCPNEECNPRLFLLGDPPSNQVIAQGYEEFIRRRPGTPGTTCPYCGQDNPDDEFIYPEDIKAAQDFLKWAATQDIGEYVESMARDFNRTTRHSGGGLFNIKMDVKRRRLTRPYAWREDLLRNLSCEICGREYGVYAIALFCPDCGCPNVHVHLQREAELINQQIELAQTVGVNGDQELAYRLLGNAHEDVLTAFETYQKTIFRYLVKQRFPVEEAKKLISKRAIGNRFQNIDRGRKLYEKIGVDPYDGIVLADIEILRLNIEKRHVIGHNLSLSDEAYVESTQGEQPGTTVNLLAEDISKFSKICGLVINRLEEDLKNPNRN
jgi:hypothetical protein